MNLLFTSPNRREILDYPEGKMHSIELTEADLAKDSVDFETLIHAIYHQIVTLDFLNPESPLALTQNENASLTDIKNFCQKLIEVYQTNRQNSWQTN